MSLQCERAYAGFLSLCMWTFACLCVLLVSQSPPGTLPGVTEQIINSMGTQLGHSLKQLLHDWLHNTMTDEEKQRLRNAIDQFKKEQREAAGVATTGATAKQEADAASGSKAKK